MTRTTNPWSWLAGAAAAAALALPAWALAQAAGVGSCPGPQAGACAEGAACPHDGGCMHGGGSHHAGGAGPRHWDPKAVTQVQGKVEEVETAGHHGHGVHLVLAVGSEKVEVMVGPDSYLQQQGLTLAQGDLLEVKGARVERGGTTFMVAQEIGKGGKTVTLRDADGTPRWAGAGAGK